MVDITFYLVTEEIAQRSGVIESRYRTKDGRFILDNKDLSYIRFTPDEYIDGLKGVEKTSKQEAMILIKENNYQMGVEAPIAPKVEVEPATEEETAEQTSEDAVPEESGEQSEEMPIENDGNNIENNEQEKEEE